MKRTNVAISFANIRTSRSTYYLLYDKCHSKTNTTIIPYSILLQILASQAKKQEKQEVLVKKQEKIGIGSKNRKKQELDTLLEGNLPFFFVFLQFPSTSPRGGLYLERHFNGGFFALQVWRAYIWRGLYMEGLLFGILQYIFSAQQCFIATSVPGSSLTRNLHKQPTIMKSLYLLFNYHQLVNDIVLSQEICIFEVKISFNSLLFRSCTNLESCPPKATSWICNSCDQ